VTSYRSDELLHLRDGRTQFGRWGAAGGDVDPGRRVLCHAPRVGDGSYAAVEDGRPVGWKSDFAHARPVAERLNWSF
jgi:hypothetical protein